MKIANFTDTYLPQNNGVAKALYEMHHTKKPWEDVIFAPVEHGDVTMVSGIPFLTCPDYNIALTRKELINDKDGFDLVHIHTPYSMMYYGIHEARKHRLPVVGTFHTDPAAIYGEFLSEGSPVTQLFSRLMWEELVKFYNSCDAIIAPSKWVKEEIEKWNVKKPIYVVPNGVDIKKFNPKTKFDKFLNYFNIEKGKKIVLFTGRLEGRKRPDTFIKAALESNSNAVFIVCGCGQMRSKLKRMVKGHKRVIFTDYIEDELLKQAFAAADIFVQTSDKETQGIVLLEAISSGCAVISTPVGTAPEVIDPEYLFEVSDYVTLARKLDALLGDETKLAALKKNNRRIAEKSYSSEFVAKEMEGVYKGLLKDFSPRITVIVPTFNEMPGVKECLDSIKNQEYTNFEIIVADGYSTDGTDKFAKKYGRVVKNRGNGPGPARNAGAYKGTGDIVAFTDADTVVPKDWLKKIAYDFATDEELIGVGGVLVPKDPRILDTLMFKFNSDLFYRFTSKVGFQQLATPNCAYRRDLFLKEKGFDETMSMFEDTELSVRMSRLGKVTIDKNLMVYNSTRRLRQESYSKLFLRYMKVYWNYLRGKPVSERHFETIEH